MSDATTVLLVDDDPQYLDYYTQRLYSSTVNFDVVQAASGRSALNICARQPIDCVILEIDLPDMSGFEVLATLVRHTYRPEMAVIVNTRLPNPFLLELALKNGALAAFHKPMSTPDTLNKAILKALSTVRKKRNREGIC